MNGKREMRISPHEEEATPVKPLESSAPVLRAASVGSIDKESCET
jgi:hypothetical protein